MTVAVTVTLWGRGRSGRFFGCLEQQSLRGRCGRSRARAEFSWRSNRMSLRRGMGDESIAPILHPILLTIVVASL